MTTTRTDEHRPSEIVPEDYDFVCVQYLWSTGSSFFDGEIAYTIEQRKIFEAHKAKTRGAISDHDHGGTCHCCGATARYVARFYHAKSNTYVNLGEICANKLEMGDRNAFQVMRRSIKDARDAIAGKRKAQALLADLGLTRAWDLYDADIDYPHRQEVTIVSVVSSIIKLGYVSEKQELFLRKLLYEIDHRAEIEARRKAEAETAADCPSGRMKIAGKVLSIKSQPSVYGDVLKMLVQHPTGFKVWGSVPRDLSDVQRNCWVEFTATVTPSDKDRSFGFYSRPVKPSMAKFSSIGAR